LGPEELGLFNREDAKDTKEEEGRRGKKREEVDNIIPEWGKSISTSRLWLLVTT